MGGGPSSEQKQAAAAQKTVADTASRESAAKIAREADQYAVAKPEILKRLNGGNPYTSFFLDSAGGPLAQGYQPVYQQLARTNPGQLPSGAYDANLRAVNAQRARDYANSITGILQNDQQAKDNALGMLTGQQQIALNSGTQLLNTASGANSSIMQAPLNSPGLGGILGGVGAAAINKIPF